MAGKNGPGHRASRLQQTNAIVDRIQHGDAIWCQVGEWPHQLNGRAFFSFIHCTRTPEEARMTLFWRQCGDNVLLSQTFLSPINWVSWPGHKPGDDLFGEFAQRTIVGSWFYEGFVYYSLGTMWQYSTTTLVMKLQLVTFQFATLAQCKALRTFMIQKECGMNYANNFNDAEHGLKERQPQASCLAWSRRCRETTQSMHGCTVHM